MRLVAIVCIVILLFANVGIRTNAASTVTLEVFNKGTRIFTGSEELAEECVIADSTGENHSLSGSKALCALQTAATTQGLQYRVSYSSLGLLLTGISGINGDWFYWVNAQFGSVGLGQYDLNPGDSLVLNYSSTTYPQETPSPQPEPSARAAQTIAQSNPQIPSPRPQALPAQTQAKPVQTQTQVRVPPSSSSSSSTPSPSMTPLPTPSPSPSTTLLPARIEIPKPTPAPIEPPPPSIAPIAVISQAPPPQNTNLTIQDAPPVGSAPSEENTAPLEQETISASEQQPVQVAQATPPVESSQTLPQTGPHFLYFVSGPLMFLIGVGLRIRVKRLIL